MSSILKTNALLESIKRRAFIPSSEETFTDEGLLEMATEEINLGLVPLIQRMHEEHLIHYVDVPIQRGVRKYKIPSRAHGNKLRDLALVDENDNIFEMFRYSISDISDFTNVTKHINSRGFYLENNNVILSDFDLNVGSSLRFYFYMRPNSLVLEKNGATVTNISPTVENNNIANISEKQATNIQQVGDRVKITSANHGFTSGDKINISASDSTPNIDGIYEILVVDSDNFSIESIITSSGSSATLTLMLDVKIIKLDKFPDVFDKVTLVDFIDHTSPNKILYYNVPVNSFNATNKQISVPANLIDEVELGNYVNLAEQTFVPNIPTELHPILAQRVAVACLEALGDEQNKQSAERKLAAMEKDAGTFLDNRVEGASQKIKSKHSTLNSTLNTLGRRNRRW